MPSPKRVKTSELMDVDTFKGYYESINSSFKEKNGAEYELAEISTQRIARMVDYTVPGGKVNRGLTVVHVGQTMSSKQLGETELKQLTALGWTIEWMQASFLVADDMMDSSITRRGHPCWYLVEEVGNAAVNDSLILLTQMELILDDYLGEHKQYSKMRRMLLETTYQTELGQLLDLTTQPPGATEVDLNLYTIERYKKIVKYKTAFYSFAAPVALGMYFADITNEALHLKVRDVCLIMGEYFQIQDDVLDCYGLPEVIGKIGTDIEDAKCSWLVVQALNAATEEQKILLKNNYGKKDHACVQRVKELFVELKLQAVFDEYETRVVSEINEKIAELGKIDKRVEDICEGLLKKIYKREK